MRTQLVLMGGLWAVASWTRNFVVAKGLTDVTFDGLVFRHVRGDALLFEDCRKTAVQAGTLSACGAWGVVFLRGADNRAEGNDIFHVGEGGICVSGGERSTLTPGNTVAVNNQVGWFGERLWSSGGELRRADGWIERTFSFTPSEDGEYVLHLMGNYGSKTMWDDIRLTGGELVNGGFETAGGWDAKLAPPPIGETNAGDVEQPYGILSETGGNRPFAGTRFAVTSHYRALSQRVRLTAGRRVTVTYRAQAWIEE